MRATQTLCFLIACAVALSTATGIKLAIVAQDGCPDGWLSLGDVICLGAPAAAPAAAFDESAAACWALDGKIANVKNFEDVSTKVKQSTEDKRLWVTGCKSRNGRSEACCALELSDGRVHPEACSARHRPLCSRRRQQQPARRPTDGELKRRRKRQTSDTTNVAGIIIGVLFAVAIVVAIALIIWCCVSGRCCFTHHRGGMIIAPAPVIHQPVVAMPVINISNSLAVGNIRL